MLNGVAPGGNTILICHESHVIYILLLPFLPLAADFLLLLWPLFFVAAARQEPHLKVRNIRKSIARGSERVVDFSQPVFLSAPLRRRNELARRAVQPATANAGSETPTWENTDASARPQVCVICLVPSPYLQ